MRVMKKILLSVFMVLPFVFTSCSDSDDDKEDNGIKVGKTEYKMNFKDEVQIEASSTNSIIYQSENEFVAEVSETGLITGGRVGEAEIKLSDGDDTKKVKVIIEPVSNLFPEPDFIFGETRESVIKKLGKPDSESDEIISYLNYSKNAAIIMYSFEGKSSSSKLSGIAVVLSTSSASVTAVTDFLTERYIMAPGNENILAVGLNGLDEKTITRSVGLSLFELDYWMILYMPYSKSSKSALMSGSMQLRNSMNSSLRSLILK